MFPADDNLIHWLSYNKKLFSFARLIISMEKSRFSVSTFFFVNGVLYATWTARLPELQAFFSMSNAELGTLLFVHALGAVVAMPFIGWLALRFSSKTTTRVSGVVFCLFISLIALSRNLVLVNALFFIIGLAAGSLDVSMNGQAVYVERKKGKPIMSSFHALFSIGMAFGAGLGALFTKFDISLTTNFMIMAALGIIALIVTSPDLVDADPEEKDVDSKKGGGFVLPTKAILPLAIIAFCCMLGEGSMADWSAIYMTKVVGQSETFGAIAFGAFAVAMTIGRIFGDYVTFKLGKENLLIWNGIFALAGLILALMFTNEWATLIGFFLIGIGLSTVVPIVYGAAGNAVGVEPSVGIAMATTIGYSGFFIGPPVIGYLADEFGLRVGLGFTLLLFAIMMILITRMKKRVGKN